MTISFQRLVPSIFSMYSLVRFMAGCMVGCVAGCMVGCVPGCMVCYVGIDWF